MSTATFQRARTDEQREARREQILSVARNMLTGHRVADLGLNELARQVGLAKSNVVRYFGTREAVLLELTRREYTDWVDELTRECPQRVSVDDVARLLARTVTTRPLLAELLTNVMTTLEHNVSPAEIIDFKAAMHDQLGRVEALLERATGPLPQQTQSVLVPGIHALINEFHSLAHPSDALRDAAAHDERIACGLADHEASLATALTLYLTGARTAQ